MILVTPETCCGGGPGSGAVASVVAGVALRAAEGICSTDAGKPGILLRLGAAALSAAGWCCPAMFQKSAILRVEEMPTSSIYGPGLPRPSLPRGVPWPIDVMVFSSTTISPAVLHQLRRVWLPVDSERSGTASSPWTSRHWATTASALAGTTVWSAVPCQTDILGHGPG